MHTKKSKLNKLKIVAGEFPNIVVVVVSRAIVRFLSHIYGHSIEAHMNCKLCVLMTIPVKIKDFAF